MLFLLVVFPGLISARVYRLIMPARELQWDGAVLEGLFYSAVNFVLALPLLWWLVGGYEFELHPWRFILAATLVLLAGPIVWPLLLVSAFKSRWLRNRIKTPYPTAWDFYFNQPRPAFALVHLAGGKILGTYWGSESFAGSFPNAGDIYFEAVYEVDGEGKLLHAVPDTQGVLLRRDQYSYIEFVGVPAEEAQ